MMNIHKELPLSFPGCPPSPDPPPPFTQISRHYLQARSESLPAWSSRSDRADLVQASVSAGFKHVCGLTPSGEAYCWGSNSSGELGDETLTDRGDPPLPWPGGCASSRSLLVPNGAAGSRPRASPTAGRGTIGVVSRYLCKRGWGVRGGWTARERKRKLLVNVHHHMNPGSPGLRQQVRNRKGASSWKRWLKLSGPRKMSYGRI